MNYFLIIVNSSNKPFSKIKTNSPKMFNSLKETCNKYKVMFNEEYKVRRCIITKKGVKLI